MKLPALVLTAGLGTRLDPLTRVLAKPAVPVAGRTLIERVLEWLRGQGVTNVVLNLHHRPETITSVVGDGAHLGLHVRYSWEQPVLGSAGGPRRALDLLDSDTFFIVNGDTLCAVDLGAMLAAHRRDGAVATLAVVPQPAPDRYNGVVVNDEGVITGFAPRGTRKEVWHFVGVQIAQASVFAGLADGVPAETVAGIYQERLLTQPGSIRAWKIDTPFTDVGTPRDYLDTVLALSQGHPSGNAIDAGSSAVSRSAVLTRTVVWPGSRVGARVRLEECVVAGAILPAGFVATKSILMPAHLVRPGDRAAIDGNVARFAL